jgi:broad specificity phosphatase PhoE
MMRVLFIRHGQSTANIGEPTKDFALVPLTDLGQEQAKELAEGWKFTPSLIVVSPFLRTQQTAAPTIKRFPDVPVATWPIHEFTLWDPVHWTGGEPKDLMHEVDHYWTAADAELRYGAAAASEGAESFAMLLERAQAALKQLEGLGLPSPVMIFTHGHFIQALRLTVLHPDWTAVQKMQVFRAFDEARWVQNTQVITAEFDGTLWHMD